MYDSDGHKVPYTNWGNRQPNWGNEKCVAAEWSNDKEQWHDWDCSAQFLWVCESPLIPEERKSHFNF